MQILCKAKRKGGTDITLDGKTYEFRPIDPSDKESPHVASIKDKAHIARLLSIPEGYEFYAPEEGDAAPAASVTAPEPEPAPEPTPEPDDTAGQDALTNLLNDPVAADRETAVAAFEFLFERAPNGKSHTDTIIKKVIEEAAKEGWIAEDDDHSAMIAQVEAAYADNT